MNYSILYILVGTSSILILGSFIFLLVTNFFRKRTIGTFMLIFGYGNTWIGEILFTTSFLIQYITKNPDFQIGPAPIISFFAVFFLMNTTNWMYFFGNRHLIHDNDVIKSFYTSAFYITLGLVAALTLSDLINSGDANWYLYFSLTGSDLAIFYPPLKWPYGILTVIIFLLASFTYVRLAFRTIQLERKAKDILTKRGLRLVTISLVTILSSGLILGAYFFGADKIAILAFLIYLTRALFIITSAITGYIGWIMPEWARRTLRGKTWLAKVYTGKIPEPKISPGNEPIDTSSSKIVEVADS